MPMRVALADDIDLLLIGARSVLESDHRIQVVGGARSSDQLLRVVERQQPDVVLVSERLPGADTLSLVATLRTRQPRLKIMVLGGWLHGGLIHELLLAGVSAYLYRGDDLQAGLIHAVDVVLRGQLYLSPSANSEYLLAQQKPGRHLHLNAEARAVLRLMAAGLTMEQVANELKLPRRRVYWVREKLRLRFDVQTNEHLISRAVADGFVRL